MATEYIDFTGHLSYARVYEPDNAFGTSNWKVNLFPENDEVWEKIKKAGIQKKVKENLDPARGPVGKFIEFTRPAYKMMNGKIVHFSGPIVYNEEGKVIVDYVDKETDKRVYSFSADEKHNVIRRGEPVLLGNGTKATVRVAVYDTQKGKGQRLESVSVLELVVYERQERELPEVVSDKRVPLSTIDIPVEETKPDGKAPW